MYIVHRFFMACVLGATGFILAHPYQAHALTIEKASIEGGTLVVTGTTKKRNRSVGLDGIFNTQSDSDNQYKFSVLYHPGDCVIKVKRGSTRRDAVVANSGLRGKRGPEGAEGQEGPEGPQGIQGLQGDKGDAADAGVGAGHWW